MKKKDMFKQLVPGIVVGFILGFVLTTIVGVNKENPIPNYIGGAMCCLVPTLLNCLVVLKLSAKKIKRKISVVEVLKRALPYCLFAIVVGLIVVIVVIEKVLGIDTRTISGFVTSIYQATLGVIVSSISAYFALKKYLQDVKYTKRK